MTVGSNPVHAQINRSSVDMTRWGHGEGTHMSLLSICGFGILKSQTLWGSRIWSRSQIEVECVSPNARRRGAGCVLVSFTCTWLTGRSWSFTLAKLVLCSLRNVPWSIASSSQRARSGWGETHSVAGVTGCPATAMKGGLWFVLRKVHQVRKQLLNLSAQLVGVEKEVAVLMERGMKVELPSHTKVTWVTTVTWHQSGAFQLQEQLPQKVLPLVSSGMKSQAYLSQNTLVEMTLGWVFIATLVFLLDLLT